MDYLKSKLKITVMTGLHIGGNKDEFEIGGVDLPVAKIRKKGREAVPYIPGSSLKGKMRSLLELEKGLEEICKCGECEICRTFGSIKKEKGKEAERVIGALIVRDLFLEDEDAYSEEKFLEIKSENSVGRGTGKSANPRFIERVLPGTVFTGDLVLRIFDESKKEQYKKTVEKALKLMEQDYLGGNGTRGYGQVKTELGEWKPLKEEE